MKHLTFVMPYYMNPGMLRHQYQLWASYDERLLDLVDFVIVDDGSPKDRAQDVERPAGVRISIYNVKIDKPWNQHGARNLGAHVAEGPWLFLTDMDHTMPEETLCHVFDNVKKDYVYTFARVDAPDMMLTRNPNGTPKPHPNTFLMTKDRYWHIGGYDEDFCGIYGTDSLFRARIKQRSTQREIQMPIVRYGREVIADASTTTLPRKEDKRYRVATKEVLARKQAAGRLHEIVTINFPWERVV